MPRMVQKRFSVSVDVPNLMLSWQGAALLAIGLGGAAVLLAVAGHAAGRAGHAPRAGRWATRTGPFAREARAGGAGWSCCTRPSPCSSSWPPAITSGPTGSSRPASSRSCSRRKPWW